MLFENHPQTKPKGGRSAFMGTDLMSQVHLRGAFSATKCYPERLLSIGPTLEYVAAIRMERAIAPGEAPGPVPPTAAPTPTPTPPAYTRAYPHNRAKPMLPGPRHRGHNRHVMSAAEIADADARAIANKKGFQERKNAREKLERRLAGKVARERGPVPKSSPARLAQSRARYQAQKAARS